MTELEVHDCDGEPVLISDAASSGNELVSCYFHGNQKAVDVSGDGVLLLLNYVAFSASAGIQVRATNAQVFANQVVASMGSNIVVHTGADGAFVLANVSIAGDDGIALGTLTGARVWHNTVVDSVSSALDLGAASGVDVRNNIFAGAGTFGVFGATSQLAHFDYNLLFDNASGACSACTPGPSSVLADPLFTNPGAWDYSPGPLSPAIDAGFDLGDDRNLAGPGLFNGAGPDIGFIEVD